MAITKFHSISKKKSFPFHMSKSVNINKISGHYHDFFEITYIYAGAGIIEIDGQAHEYKSHQFNFTPPDITHKIISKEKMNHKRASLGLGKNLFEYFQSNLGLSKVVKDIAAKKMFILDVSETEVKEIEDIIEAIYLEYSFRQKEYEIVICFELQRLLIKIKRILLGEKIFLGRFINIDPQIYKALQYIEKNYYNIKTSDDFLNDIALHEKYFIRLFKKNVGFTPINYLNRVRIEKVCLELFNTNKRIIDIAYDCGFNDLSYFNRQFKKMIGLTPMEMKKKCGGKKKLLKQIDRLKFPNPF